MPYSGTIAALAFACLVVCMYPLLRWLRWQWAWRKLPVISGASKVTHALLMRAAAEYSHAVRLPGRHGVLITDPTLALHLLKSFGIRDVSSYQRYRSFLGSALVALPSATDSQVSLHTLVRAALLPLFTASHVRLVHDSLLGCTTRLLTRLSTSTARDAPLYRAMQHFAVDATAAAFLGQPLEDADARRIIVLLEEFLSEAEHDAGGSSSALRTWWMWLLEATQMLRGRPREGAPKKSTRLMNTFERALDRVLATQEEVAASGKLCVLSALKGLKREARSQSVGLLFAGLNSAKELVYMLTMLACHPELQRKARAEVDALYSSCCASAEVGPHLGEPTASGEDAARSVRAHVREPSFDELWTATSLPYCSKLVLEALRLSPGVEHMRVRASADMWYPTSSGTLFFPSGLPFVISPSLLHRHPRYWSSADKPLAALFDSPGRAPPGDSKTTSDLESSTLLSQGDNSGGKFLPFSAGPKGCIASQFAMYEMRMVLVCMLKRFELHQGLQAPGGLHRVQLTPR